MAEISLEGVSRTYPDGTVAVAHVHLAVGDRELLTLVGPSGSGKTTLLRIIAGLDRPTTGAVRIGGRRVDDLPPSERGLAMVFQEDALFPFLSAGDNMAFGLRVRRVEEGEVDRRVRAEARVLGLEELLDRMPSGLAAGERQAVAMGRALVRVPTAFLLDEPMARLDARRRREMRREIALLHRGYGVSTIYATNDPEDALALGDRVAVLEGGELRQVSPPSEVYERPADLFVAGFMGTMNSLEGVITVDDRGVVLEAPGISLPLSRPAFAVHGGRRVVLGVRPERVGTDGPGPEGSVLRTAFLGRRVEVTVEIAPGVEWIVPVPAPGPRPGERLRIALEPGSLHLFDASSGRPIAHPL